MAQEQITKESFKFHPIAKVLPQELSDGSRAFNVGFYTQDGDLVCTIGCLSQAEAYKLDQVANSQSWLDLP